MAMRILCVSQEEKLSFDRVLSGPNLVRCAVAPLVIELHAQRAPPSWALMRLFILVIAEQHRSAHVLPA